MPILPALPAYRLALAILVLPGLAAAQTPSALPTMELPALVELFLLPADAPPGAMLPWNAATGTGSRVRWASTGPVQAPRFQQQQGHTFQRAGRVTLVNAGAPLYDVVHQQRRTPGVWSITLLGPRAGAVRIEIQAEDDTDEMQLDVPQLLVAAGWTVAAFRCSRETSPAIFGRVVHAVERPGRRAAWLEESWDYGAATGMRSALTILHRQADADDVECVTR